MTDIGFLQGETSVTKPPTETLLGEIVKAMYNCKLIVKEKTQNLCIKVF
jgi:hypothetical protein